MSMYERNCKSCGKPLKFVESATSGKWMALDRDPVEGGNVVITPMGVAQVFPNWQAAIDAYCCLPLYQDHHVSCPSAEEWRARARAKAQQSFDTSLG